MAPVRRDVQRRRLGLLAAGIAVVIVAEVIGGILTGSLALLADAAHASTDFFSIILALYAMHIARRMAGPAHSFGFMRAEILAAFVNALLLGALGFFIVVEAVERFLSPRDVDGLLVSYFGLGIMVVEIVGALLLHRVQGESLNIRSAFLHLIGDLVATAGVVVSGVAIHFTGATWLDPAVSIGIAGILGYWAYRLVKESSHILMEGVPEEIDLEALRSRLRSLRGVQEVHDLHVWTLTSGVYSMSVHVVADHCDPSHDLVSDVREAVESGYGLTHVTVQLEDPHHHCGEEHD